MQRVLITGGAGFIGSHLADRLLELGYQVRVLDSLVPQVHGTERRGPPYLADEVELLVGDVRDRDMVNRALLNVDTVFHLAALVGVGQSMYAPYDYVNVNEAGTAQLLEGLQRSPVERLVVASSMSVYGEGRYLNANGAVLDNVTRSSECLLAQKWDPQDEAGQPLEACPTPEDKPADLASIYALSKFSQERMCLIFGQAYRIPTVALRFFNVYGTRQALSNPYTGVLAIFASRILNHKPPLIFEDGNQLRDFVSVHDVTRACVLAAQSPKAIGKAINVASGRPRTIREVASALTECLGKDIAPQLTGKFRAGDIRHCIADIDRARQLLGYEPEVDFSSGLEELGLWLARQRPADRVDAAHTELVARGLSY